LEVLSYSTSADASGDTSRVVGYGASVIYSGAGTTGPSAKGLARDRQEALLRLARGTVEAHDSGNTLPAAPKDGPFGEARAVFVTIHKGGQLRGCIGRLEAEESLAEAVRHMAVESATKDPRFPPIQPQELKDLSYEISVLSPPQRVADHEEVKIGEHGVILKRGARGGVFLPKVAESFGYDKEAFLSELCSQKAGLPRDCWQDPSTEISVFTAPEFAE
jgi:AmmeMemoRadiSam system protein A